MFEKTKVELKHTCQSWLFKKRATCNFLPCSKNYQRDLFFSLLDRYPVYTATQRSRRKPALAVSERHWRMTGEGRQKDKFLSIPA